MKTHMRWSTAALITLALAGQAAAQPTVAGAPAAAAASMAPSQVLPDAKPYSNAVSLTAPIEGISLSTALTSLSRAVGLTVVANGVPDATIRTSFKQRPFREMLATLINVYGEGKIGYTLIGKDVLVIGTADVLARVTGTSTSPTAQPTPEDVTRIYAISNAKETGEAIAATLGVSRQTAVGESLIVVATPSTQAKVADLISQLDQQAKRAAAAAAAAASAAAAAAAVGNLPAGGTTVAPPAPVVRSFQLKGDGAGLETAVKTFYPDVQVLVMTSTRSYILKGIETQVQAAQDMLSTLDVAAPAPAAPAAVEMVENTFQLLADPTDVQDMIRNLLPGVTAYVMPSQNMLVVRSSPEDQVRLVKLMNQINVMPSEGSGERGVLQRTFKLSHANVDIVSQQLTTMLSSLVITKPATSQGVAGSAISVPDQATLDSSVVCKDGTLKSTANEVNPCTNSGGVADDQVAAKASYVSRAKQAANPTGGSAGSGEAGSGTAASTGENKIEAGTKAADAASAVSSFTSTPEAAVLGAIPGSTAYGSSSLGANNTVGSLTNKISLVSDRRTNTLIATGNARQLQMIASAIAALDVPVRQLKLTVRIEKMTGDSTSKLGLAWNVSAAGVNVGASDTGLSVGYNLGSASAFSLGVKLDALKSTGKSQTLTNTTLLVNDQNTVNLNTGGSLYVKTQSSSPNGNTADFKKFDYGMQVAFRPLISNDGNINLQVGTQVTDKPNGDFATYFTIGGQKLSTNINLQNGQTVVLGGVVTTTDSANKSGVPVLSEIPVLGGLFSKTTSTGNQETLIIMVTAEVVDEQGRPIAPSGARTNGVSVGQPSVTVGQPALPAPTPASKP